MDETDRSLISPASCLSPLRDYRATDGGAGSMGTRPRAVVVGGWCRILQRLDRVDWIPAADKAKPGQFAGWKGCDGNASAAEEVESWLETTPLHDLHVRMGLRYVCVVVGAKRSDGIGWGLEGLIALMHAGFPAFPLTAADNIFRRGERKVCLNVRRGSGTRDVRFTPFLDPNSSWY